MYQVNDVVVHVINGGVFKIASLQHMDIGNGEEDFFIIEPYIKNDQNASLSIMLPTSKSEKLLRPLTNKEEALDLFTKLKSIEPIWYNDAKTRKIKFQEIYQARCLENYFLLLKSLYVQQNKLIEQNKALNLIDYDFLKRIRQSINDEFSIVLSITPEEVEKKFIESM
jgi:RNA polymerase-interacting CarD/CdnL/TRCF family regulator